MGGERKESGTQIHMVAPSRLDVLRTDGAMTVPESETVEMGAQVDDLITVEKSAPSQNNVVTGLTLLLVLAIAWRAALELPKAYSASRTGNKYLCGSAQRSESRTMFIRAIGVSDSLMSNSTSMGVAPTGVDLESGDNNETPATSFRCEHTD